MKPVKASEVPRTVPRKSKKERAEEAARRELRAKRPPAERKSAAEAIRKAQVSEVVKARLADKQANR